jgi:hypothetical protein
LLALSLPPRLNPKVLPAELPKTDPSKPAPAKSDTQKNPAPAEKPTASKGADQSNINAEDGQPETPDRRPPPTPDELLAMLAQPPPLPREPLSKPVAAPASNAISLDGKTPVASKGTATSNINTNDGQPVAPALRPSPSPGELPPTRAQSVPGPVSNASSTAGKPVEMVSVQAPVAASKEQKHPAETAALKLQPVADSSPAPQPIVGNLLVSSHGTRGALSTETVKTGAEKNEIAGEAAQAAPVSPAQVSITSAKAVSSSLPAGNAIGATASKNSGSPQAAAASPLNAAAEMLAKSGPGVATAAIGKPASVSVVDPTAQADRLGHLLNQQVVMVRQSGANNLAVSLKLDPQTELSLQLTNHNGQIEASLRWERGDVSNLGAHWKDLQESLAKQNVQLLPLENRPPMRASAPVAGSSSTASNFNQQSSQPRRQSREPEAEFEPATKLSSPSTPKKATPRTASQRNWESWA